ncbi:MAG: hypothetical protein WCP89_03350 [archaeon]
MKHKIIKHEKNPFLHREEIIIEIEAETTPGFEELRKELGKDEKLTVIKEIRGKFGQKKFTAEVYVYASEAAKHKAETVSRKARKKINDDKKKADEEAKAKAAAPAA